VGVGVGFGVLVGLGVAVAVGVGDLSAYTNGMPISEDHVAVDDWLEDITAGGSAVDVVVAVADEVGAGGLRVAVSVGAIEASGVGVGTPCTA
jgi:hypothetical protein